MGGVLNPAKVPSAPSSFKYGKVGVVFDSLGDDRCRTPENLVSPLPRFVALMLPSIKTLLSLPLLIGSPGFIRLSFCLIFSGDPRTPNANPRPRSVTVSFSLALLNGLPRLGRSLATEVSNIGLGGDDSG